ncbi:hypothetical protein COU76_01760 [Candidatus Peregrinibacteria bacterium CG10_big_fil_rev_8_21_14_0_10_49_10]|nr:MAG: hypothetical protein COU76_01760 [Candidatus Peregrinibacteria bacterium CG10_big_fil_rev_8_21_14_0_10_49_10]
MENGTNNITPSFSRHPKLAKHVAAQVVAPFVGEIVGFFNPESTAYTAANVQWAVSAIASATLVEVQHRVFHGLQKKIGKVRSSIAAVLIPSAVTTTMSFIGHSLAETDAKTSSAIVCVLSLLGYGTLQCFQLLSQKKEI